MGITRIFPGNPLSVAFNKNFAVHLIYKDLHVILKIKCRTNLEGFYLKCVVTCKSLTLNLSFVCLELCT